MKSRRLAVVAALLGSLAGCGGSGGHAATGIAPSAAVTSAALPAGWALAQTHGGAALPHPASWRVVGGDPGTLTAQLTDASGRIVGYLNLTPRQGAERAANWATFRPSHERDERDRDVRVLAFDPAVRLHSGTGTCLQDSYTTFAGNRYVELACLIEGPRAAVVLGAAPPQDWPREERVIRTAIGAARL